MKNFYKIVMIIIFLLCTMLLSVRAEASDTLSENVGERYVITRGNGEFEAYKSSAAGSAPAFKSESLAEIV